MSVYKSYINSMIDNLHLNVKEPIELDLILDGGGFKGSYLIGALLYLQELEKRNYVKIIRISGSSIGGILGALYLVDKLDQWDELYNNIRHAFKKTLNLKIIHKLIEDVGSKLNENEYKKLNNRLYLNYFDIKKKQEEVICQYTSNSDVSECLKYTSYLPILTDGNLHYNNKVDGARPHLFETRGVYERKILYISLNFIGKIKNFLNTSSDKNGTARMLKGIIDIHDFFSEEQETTMCSYLNNWRVYDYGFHRFKELIWVVFIYFMMLSSVIYNRLNPWLSSYSVFNLIKNIFKKFVIDIYIKIVFT